MSGYHELEISLQANPYFGPGVCVKVSEIVFAEPMFIVYVEAAIDITGVVQPEVLECGAAGLRRRAEENTIRVIADHIINKIIIYISVVLPSTRAVFVE